MVFCEINCNGKFQFLGKGCAALLLDGFLCRSEMTPSLSFSVYAIYVLCANVFVVCIRVLPNVIVSLAVWFMFRTFWWSSNQLPVKG